MDCLKIWYTVQIIKPLTAVSQLSRQLQNLRPNIPRSTLFSILLVGVPSGEGPNFTQ